MRLHALCEEVYHLHARGPCSVRCWLVQLRLLLSKPARLKDNRKQLLWKNLVTDKTFRLSYVSQIQRRPETLSRLGTAPRKAAAQQMSHAYDHIPRFRKPRDMQVCACSVLQVHERVWKRSRTEICHAETFILSITCRSERWCNPPRDQRPIAIVSARRQSRCWLVQRRRLRRLLPTGRSMRFSGTKGPSWHDPGQTPKTSNTLAGLRLFTQQLGCEVSGVGKSLWKLRLLAPS